MRYLARWWHYGAGENVYFEFEADDTKAADKIVLDCQCKNGITPGDYELFLMLDEAE